MFNWFKKKKPTLGTEPHPITLSPHEVERRERVRQRIKRIEDYLPQVDAARKPEYEAELKKLRATLIASGIE